VLLALPSLGADDDGSASASGSDASSVSGSVAAPIFSGIRWGAADAAGVAGARTVSPSPQLGADGGESLAPSISVRGVPREASESTVPGSSRAAPAGVLGAAPPSELDWSSNSNMNEDDDEEDAPSASRRSNASSSSSSAGGGGVVGAREEAGGPRVMGGGPPPRGHPAAATGWPSGRQNRPPRLRSVVRMVPPNTRDADPPTSADASGILPGPDAAALDARYAALAVEDRAGTAPPGPLPHHLGRAPRLDVDGVTDALAPLAPHLDALLARLERGGAEADAVAAAVAAGPRSPPGGTRAEDLWAAWEGGAGRAAAAEARASQAAVTVSTAGRRDGGGDNDSDDDAPSAARRAEAAAALAAARSRAERWREEVAAEEAAARTGGAPRATGPDRPVRPSGGTMGAIYASTRGAGGGSSGSDDSGGDSSSNDDSLD